MADAEENGKASDSGNDREAGCMIGKNQIRVLKLLGYKDTQEDGAILEFEKTKEFVWRGESFDEVIKRHNSVVEGAVISGAAHRVLRGGYLNK